MGAKEKKCGACGKNFTVEAEDFAHYEKIGVLAPKNCPDCRKQLRHVHRNERNLYKRDCDKCGKGTVSIYSPNKPDVVWCRSCWWADDWDSRDFGIEYDPQKPFFEQVHEVLKKVPKVALVQTNSVNSEYMNLAADCKNCYMIFESSNNEDCTNCYWIQKSKNCVDCSHTHELEYSYESDDCHDSSRLFYCRSCHKCLNSYFLLDCKGCTDCIASVNLRNKKYYIFNEPYSKGEYERKLEEFKLNTYEGVEALRKKFEDFVKSQPRKYAEITNAENCSGNYIRNAKNCKECFSAYDARDCKYSVYVWRGATDCWDSHTAGRSADMIYNSYNNGMEVSNLIASGACWGSSFVEHSFHCMNSMQLLGCSGLKKQKHCVLNKQYSEEDYKKLKEEIVQRLKAEGIYGETFPPEMSSFGYNETTAQDEYPLTKEEALAKGFKWEDYPRGTFGKETLKWEAIDNLDKTKVKKAIFACGDCSKNYRFIPSEVIFYEEMKIPLPRLCPDCRHLRRMKARGGKVLIKRRCDCELKIHENHKERCPNEFETNNKDKDKIVYCEQCYNAEVV